MSGGFKNDDKKPAAWLLPPTAVEAVVQHAPARHAAVALLRWVRRDAGAVDALRCTLTPDILRQCSDVLVFGAAKYSPYNWEAGIAFTRIAAAGVRHALSAGPDGEELDPETGLPHLRHLYCNVIFALHYELTMADGEFDDRPPPGRVSYERRAAAEPKVEARYRVDYSHEGGDWVQSEYLRHEYTLAALKSEVCENPIRYCTDYYRAANVDDPNDTFLLSDLVEAEVPEAEARYLIEWRYNGCKDWCRSSVNWPDEYTEAEADRALRQAQGLGCEYRKRRIEC